MPSVKPDVVVSPFENFPLPVVAVSVTKTPVTAEPSMSVTVTIIEDS